MDVTGGLQSGENKLLKRFGFAITAMR